MLTQCMPRTNTTNLFRPIIFIYSIALLNELKVFTVINRSTRFVTRNICLPGEGNIPPTKHRSRFIEHVI